MSASRAGLRLRVPPCRLPWRPGLRLPPCLLPRWSRLRLRPRTAVRARLLRRLGLLPCLPPRWSRLRLRPRTAGRARLLRRLGLLPCPPPRWARLVGLSPCRLVLRLRLLRFLSRLLLPRSRLRPRLLRSGELSWRRGGGLPRRDRLAGRWALPPSDAPGERPLCCSTGRADPCLSMAGLQQGVGGALMKFAAER